MQKKRDSDNAKKADLEAKAASRKAEEDKKNAEKQRTALTDRKKVIEARLAKLKDPASAEAAPLHEQLKQIEAELAATAPKKGAKKARATACSSF